jgi:ABC-type transporter Mla subunit MlaD
MSNEEFDRKMEFIVDQQAQFAADIQVMRQVHDADVKSLREQDRNLSTALSALAEVVDNVAQAQQTAATQISELTENVAELTEAGRRTDDRLNILVNTVERYISGNGKKASDDKD